jgi:hypothetical protein
MKMIRQFRALDRSVQLLLLNLVVISTGFYMLMPYLSSWGIEMCPVTLLYHASPAQSTPSLACTGARPPTSLPLELRGLQSSR